MMSGRHMRVDMRGPVSTGRFSSSLCWYLGLLVNQKRDRTITAYVVGS